MDVLSLRKFLVPEFIFGSGARGLAGRYSRNFAARKALVVSDPGVIAAGWTRDVTDSLDEAGISYSVFSSVTPNTRAEEVMAGVEIYREEECNVIVAVGGGSPIDCAKGIGIVSSNREHILSFEGVDRIAAPMPPLICIPTTLSSADISQFAIITDSKAERKVSIISKALMPDLSLIDPQTLTSMPPYLAASTVFDSLSHAMEAFVSNASSPITDLHALEAIRLLSCNLLESIKTPGDIELKRRIMLGALYAGMAFSNASLGALHAMAHSLGGFSDMFHGVCNAMLLEHVIAFNFDAVPEKYRRIGEEMGLHMEGLAQGEQREHLVEKLRQLRSQLGLERTVGEAGLRRADIPRLAQMAQRDPLMITNPRRPNLREVEEIYEKAF